VGLLMSFLVAAVIIYFDRVRPRFWQFCCDGGTARVPTWDQ